MHEQIDGHCLIMFFKGKQTFYVNISSVPAKCSLGVNLSTVLTFHDDFYLKKHLVNIFMEALLSAV